MSAILTLNAGSSSVKFSVYAKNGVLEERASGQVESLGADASLIIKHDGGKDVRSIGAADHAGALAAILDAIGPLLGGRAVDGVGHRIVHGGVDYAAPVLLSDAVIAKLETLSPLAPLHQPYNLAGVAAARQAFPNAVQVGCFDTAFHRAHPWVNDTFALPRKYFDQGVRRYGFHGLSYQYVAERLRRDHPELAAGRVVVAHLGNGASMCAMKDGVSVGSTMGFSALDGLPMGSRCGQLDPGVILYFLSQGMTPDEISRLLYTDSGLKGLSGISHDMRTLLASDAPEAAEAIDYYVFRIRRELGAMSAVLGGLDALVFCGGVGEHAAPIRARALSGMGYLGLELDGAANARNGPVISAGPVAALVIPTDEERVIAEATVAHLDAGDVDPHRDASPALHRQARAPDATREDAS